MKINRGDMTNSYSVPTAPQILKIPSTRDSFGLPKLDFDQFIEIIKLGNKSALMAVPNQGFKSTLQYSQKMLNSFVKEVYHTFIDLAFRSLIKQYGDQNYSRRFRLSSSNIIITRYLKN